MTKKVDHKSVSEKYKDALKVVSEEFGIENPMALPRVMKTVVNMGTGDKLRDKTKKEALVRDFGLITGQKPKVQPARISVAGFAIRAGMPVGLTATLRGPRMFDFLDKLVTITLPRLRDFRGVSDKSFDKAGNYTLGLHEHTVFPDIDLATVDKPHGLEMTVVIKNSNPEKSKRLLELMGVPFVKN